MTSRRQFLWTSLAALGVGPRLLSAAEEKPRTILVCSGWQTVNIGDIAHTPGLLRVLEREWPELSVILWPKSPLDRGAQGMIRTRFPKMRLVREMAAKAGTPREDDPSLADAFREAELFLHGSGPSLVAKEQAARWVQETGKPWGVAGTTLDPEKDEKLRKLLDSAAFIYTRETKSLAELKRLDCQSPVLDFAPDATFAVDLRNEAAADQVLAEHHLVKGQFLCVIPRLRYTPYWEIHHRPSDDAETQRKIKVNAEFAEVDHAKLRAGIVAWVRQTKSRVLLCPEMTYQTPLLKTLLYDQLPDDVKPHVTALNHYWLTDEAASVYARCRAVLSGECHSPILAIAAGQPAMYVRQPTDTWKGQMYPDLGLGDWAPEIDKVTGENVADELLKIEANYNVALATAKAAQEAAAARHKALVATMKKVLG